ncbi:uncharacterized protein LOC113359037 [Papaver somniferum]|uniref:uncharacterized protein LOC113359037 n=1 Tax=Papaver somniferum TaxID=3469 RepID=UPI000E6F6490|nr:uncharacterized protein LOC113359037 [Papaver somniferum]
MKKIYKRLWKLPLLPRINQFMWKCVKDVLSTRDKLTYAIQDGDFSCAFCSQVNETAMHCILECPLVKPVWFAALGIHTPNNVSLVNWLCNNFENLEAGHIQEENMCKITIVAWCIWTHRYNKIFKGTTTTPDIIIQNCRKYISEYIEMARKRPVNNHKQVRLNLHWTPPPYGTFTINVDGYYYNSSGGIGLTIRNFAGKHQGSKCVYLAESLSAEHAECRGLWEAVKWTKELNLKEVFFELDSKLVVDAVTKEECNLDWRLHNLVKDIKTFFMHLALGIVTM